MDEIEDEKVGKKRTDSVGSPSSKARPPVASKPAKLQKGGSTLADLENWEEDEEFSGADLMITQKPKRSSDMTDPHVVVDRIFNEEDDVAW